MNWRCGRRWPVASDSPPARFSREMGLNRAEFERSLPSAVAPRTYHVEGRRYIIDHPEGRVLIILGETGERRIAALALPVTPVEFCFEGLDGEARSRFMERFDRYFQRGGG